MPYSFVQIEQDKSRTIHWSVSLLFLLYFLAAIILVVLIKAYLGGYFGYSGYGVPVSLWSFMDWPTFGWTLGGSSLAGLFHFSASTNFLIDKTLHMMGGRIADTSKDREQVFKNVVDEVSVATGGKFKIEAWVIPTAAMNAFALQDFEGRSVIGITEGLLIRLNREQLEAVIAHEAGHIASGDCKETTVTTVLFKLFDNVCDVSMNMFRFSGRGYSRREGGGFIGIVLLVMIVAMAFKFISLLGGLFVSREREYRADAISARLTRNPKALAEALYIIDHRWKGGGMPGEAMEAIFILSPRKIGLEDQEDFFADLFSTHPPINKRISILLDMAHARLEDIKFVSQEAEKKFRSFVGPDEPKQWMVMKDGQWLGPLTLPALRSLGWMTPNTPVRAMGGAVVRQAFSDPVLGSIFLNTQEQRQDQCPRCNIPLLPANYEGQPVSFCDKCDGYLVAEKDALQIVWKKENAFDQRIYDLAKVVYEQGHPLKRRLGDQIYAEAGIMCPSCMNPNKRMIRRLVNVKYPVEVDRCPACKRVWFDKDELEILQAMYEMEHPAG